MWLDVMLSDIVSHSNVRKCLNVLNTMVSWTPRPIDSIKLHVVNN